MQPYTSQCAVKAHPTPPHPISYRQGLEVGLRLGSCTLSIYLYQQINPQRDENLSKEELVRQFCG